MHYFKSAHYTVEVLVMNDYTYDTIVPMIYSNDYVTTNLNLPITCYITVFLSLLYHYLSCPYLIANFIDIA